MKILSKYFIKIRKYLTKKNILIALVITGIIIFVGISLVLILNKNKTVNNPSAGNTTADSQTEIIPPEANIAPLDVNEASTSGLPKDDKSLGIVLLGYGGAGHDGGYLTDAMQVLYFDFEKDKAVLISIPRDLWVKMPNGKETKINAVWISGNKQVSGNSLIKNILTDITGLRMDYVATIDFVGFQRTIGVVLNGVEVNVGETLNDPWYPIKGEEVNICGKTPEEVAALSQKYSGFELERQFPCRYKHLHFEKGTNIMQGGDALEYVRSRHGSSDGDIARGRRQQEVLLAIAKKIIINYSPFDLIKIYNSFAKHVTTDISLNAVQYLGPLITKAKDFKDVEINLSTTNVLNTGTGTGGASIIIPKAGMFTWEQIHSYIKSEMEKP